MAKVKKWSDLTAGQQMAIAVAAGIQASLLIAALWDMWHRRPEEIRGDRRLWTLAAFVNFVGPLAYFRFGRRRWRRITLTAAGGPRVRGTAT